MNSQGWELAPDIAHRAAFDRTLGEPADAYFAAGVTDEIATRLSSVAGLDVISSRSAMQYAGSDKTTREIGEELGVTYVDPTPNFVAFGDPEPLFLKKDHHWTPKGTELVADAVVARLKQ